MILADVIKILGGRKALLRSVRSRMDLIDLINTGLTKTALLNLARYLSLSLHQMAALLPVTERTIQRYDARDHFNPVVSEHILQIAEVAAKGAEVFKDKENFLEWLSLPNKALANKTPLSLLKTKYGTDMVMDVLVRIQHGVFS